MSGSRTPILMFVNAGFVTPGVLVDAGGYIIYLGSDGKLHVKKVPPGPGPDGWGILPAASSLLATLEGVKNVEALRAETVKAIETSAHALARSMAATPAVS